MGFSQAYAGAGSRIRSIRDLYNNISIKEWRPISADSHNSVNNTDKSKRRTHEAKRILKDIIYPHSIHPALVPGVSIEDQKVKYGVDKPILIVVGGLIVAFVAWGVIAPDQVFDASSAALDWVMRNLGWVFTALATFLMFLLLILAFSKYGKIPLGVDGEKPEFSTVSWAAMLLVPESASASSSSAPSSR